MAWTYNENQCLGDQFNFDADPDPDPGSALEKKWLRIQVISLRFTEFFNNFLLHLFCLFLF